MGLTIVDGSKIKWAVDECILVKHMNVLLGDNQVILNGIRSRLSNDFHEPGLD